MKCPKCCSDNPDTQRFCGDCGTQLPFSEEAAFSPTETLETPKEELTTGSTFAGRYQIIEELRKGGMRKVTVAHLRLGRTYMQKGMYEEALTEFQEAITLSGGSTDMIAALGHAQAVSGRKGLAEQTLQQLKAISKERYVSTYEIAIIYLGLGQKEQALDLLEKSYDERSSYLIYLRVDPRLDPLWPDPRFTTRLKKMNL
jgi:tetratricopeptide (TPR) repeat protein